MKELPKIVAETKVGKNVNVKVWRNNRILNKSILLGRLETSDDFLAESKKPVIPNNYLIEGLKVKVRLLSKNDIQSRNLPSETTGVVITEIEQGSPIDYLVKDNIIVEAQGKKIKTIKELDNLVKIALRKSEKTILLAIYNNQNQKRYIGVKLN